MSESLIRMLQEKRANIFDGMKAILDKAEAEKRELSAEETSQYEARNADLDRVQERVTSLTENMRAAEDTAKFLAELGARPAERTALETAETRTRTELSEFLTRGNSRKDLVVRAERPMGTEEYRVLSKLTAGAGANVVPISFYDRLIAHLIEVSGILKAGPTVLNTNSGEQIQIPKTTAHSTSTLTAEAGAIAASDPTFGQVPLDAYKYPVLLQVSTELALDTAVDLTGYIAMQAGRAVGNALGAHLMTGTGTNQPNGLVTAATLGVTGGAGVTGAFTADNVIDLMFSVIAPYRNSASCGWLLKDASLAAVRKLKDTQGRYLWEPSLQVGAPDQLLGKQVNTDPNVAAVALSAKSLLFGDISQYFVRTVNGIRFERSDEYAFANDLITYRCILRGDGELPDLTGAVKYFIGNAA